jgi:hypothetical protein
MRLAEVPSRLNEVSEKYQVPQRLRAAGEAVCESANSAYRVALNHPRTSATAGVVLAAALIGGVLWYLFHDRRRSTPERSSGTRTRAGQERRKRTKGARAAAAA